ncbi:haloalkane dehalogenase [Candidatus Poriferisocius sp.]|uniref:haloalkane dehalogenase n=1 Tax=Candidatus Poriferisocius sp. TaxID=3101276 RepID=UPI003B029AC2
MSTRPISPDFPFDSKYAAVHGSKIHYIDEGEGGPILFLHGNPTSNYLWRNVIPHLDGQGRCIAPDLIGMGKSDKPDIQYGFMDSYRYLRGFIEELGLKDLTLVVHDWGSGLGFHYATENPGNVKAIAFMESLHDVPPVKELPLSVRIGTAFIRNDLFGKFIVGHLNLLIKKMLPSLIERDLTKEELAVYAAPYPTKESRRPLWVWPQEVPYDAEGGTPVGDAFVAWRDWLSTSKIPKLCLYTTPGAGIKEREAQKVRETFVNTDVVHVGEGSHFIQEDCPHEIGEALSDWYARVN